MGRSESERVRGSALCQEVALLLTATVFPNPGIAGVTAQDPEERSREYVRTVQYYLTHHQHVRNIVLAENSGWAPSRLEAILCDNPYAKQVEFLNVGRNDFPGVLGKGYGEAVLVDSALEVSRLLQSSDLIVKLTGRQQVRNLSRLLSRLPGSLSFACDIRDHGIYELLHIAGAGHYCDTRLFVLEKTFFSDNLRYLHRACNEKDGEFNLEDAYYRCVKAMPLNKQVVTRFPVEPDFRGRAGHWHKDYGTIRERAKYWTRAAIRLVAPALKV